MREPKPKPKAENVKIQPREVVAKEPVELKEPTKEGPKLEIPPVKGPDGKPLEKKKDEPKPKIPFVVVARSIENWVNRDPEGRSEIDHVHAAGDVKLIRPRTRRINKANDIAGQTVDIQNYPDGYRMVVIGDPSDKAKPKWGVVRSDKLTTFGFDITIDQRSDMSIVKGEGSMEILSTNTMEGKKSTSPPPCTSTGSTAWTSWGRRNSFTSTAASRRIKSFRV